MHFYNIYKNIRLLLFPFMPFYILIFYLIKIIKKPEKYGIPIICIGNITTGGTGKTPTVIEIAKILKGIGYSPGIVSRGYRGSKSAEGAIVSDCENILLSPSEAGDEPFLISMALKNIPVIIGKHRQNAIHKLINDFTINVILMDDGFQNNSVYKNINIVNFDSASPFGNGLLLPAGDMREFACSLKRADLIIVNKADLISEKDFMSLKSKLKKYSDNIPVFKAYYKNEFLYRVNDTEKKLPVEEISGKNILIISSIANPNTLMRTIKKIKPAGIKLFSYPDHHWYNEKDIDRIIRESDKYDLAVITEKDYVKMMGYSFPDKFLVLKISLMIEEKNVFVEKLKGCLKEKK